MTDADRPLVEVAGATRTFGSSTEVLRGVDLTIAPHESVAVLGPSGCGKSTLLNLIGGLLPPSSGTVRFDGRDLGELSTKELAALRSSELGFVFQSHHLLPQCTALENVLVPTLALSDKTARETAPERARTLLSEVGLSDRLDHRPAELSGGERQRVAVVRALINRPRLLLADEPTGSLDERGADRLGELLVALNSEHDVALFVVTHSRRIADRMGRAVELRDGVLAENAPPAGQPR